MYRYIFYSKYFYGKISPEKDIVKPGSYLGFLIPKFVNGWVQVLLKVMLKEC